MEKGSYIRKSGFTIVDLLIIFAAALLLFIGYDHFSEQKNDRQNETITITSAVLTDEIIYGEHIGKITTGDTLFDKKGDEIGKVTYANYDIISQDKANLTLKCEFRGHTDENAEFFVNTASFCGYFRVAAIENIREEKI